MTSIDNILREIPRNFWIMLQDINEKEKRLKEFQRNFLCTSLVQVELKRIGRYYKQRNADREYIKKRFSKIRDVEEKLQKAREEVSKNRVSRLPVRRKRQTVIRADEELRKIKQTYETMKLSTDEIIAKYEIDKTNKSQGAIAEDLSSKTEKVCPDANLNSKEKDENEVLHFKPLVCSNVRQQLKECRDMLKSSDIQKLAYWTIEKPAVAEQTVNEVKNPNCTTQDNDEKPPHFVDVKRTKNGSSGILREKDIPVVKKRINRNLINTKTSVAPSKAQRMCFPETKLSSRNRLVQRTLLNRNVVAPSAKTQLKANCPDNNKLAKRKLEYNENIHAQPKRNKYNMSNELEGILNANRAIQHVKKLETENPTGSNGSRAIKRKIFTIPEETGETQSDPDVGKSLSRPRKQPKLVNSSLLESLIKDSFSNICMANERKDNLLSKIPDNYSIQNPFFNSNPEDLQNDMFSIPGTLENALSNIYDASMAQMNRNTVEKPPLAATFTRTVPTGMSSVSETFTPKAEINRENSDDESLNSFETAKTVQRNSPRIVPNRHEMKPDNKPETFDLTMFEDMWSSMLNDSETFKIDEMGQENPPGLNGGMFSGSLNFANPTLFSDSESETAQ